MRGKLIRTNIKATWASVTGWVLLLTGAAVLPLSVNADPATEVVGESISEICADTDTLSNLGAWTHNTPEGTSDPESEFNPNLGTPSAYTVQGLSSTPSGSATNLSNLPVSKDDGFYISYPFETSADSRIIIDRVEYGDDVVQQFKIQAQLFSITDGTPSAIADSTSTEHTPDFVNTSYNSEEFDFNDTLLVSGTSYELRLYVWADSATVEGFDDFGILTRPCLPGSPVIDGIEVTDTFAEVAFTPPSISGGSEITNYEYSIDGGAWTARDPASTTSPISIPVGDISNPDSFEVALRSVTVVGEGQASEPQAFSAATPLCESVAKARSQKTVGGSLFLGGSYIELGISSNGNFGTTDNKPTGFFGTTNSKVGMSVDYDGFGCEENLSIDFFLPGSPEERFAVGAKILDTSSPIYAGLSALGGNVSSGLVSNTPTITDLSSGTTLRGKVVSVLSQTGGPALFEVTQLISFGETDMYFTNTVTIKNISADAVSSARYMRSFDPDNTVFRGGSYTTENTVLAQRPDDGYSSVRAQVADPAYLSDALYLQYGTRAPILFYSTDIDSRAGAFGFSNSNPYDNRAYSTPLATGSPLVVDGAITMTMDFGSLEPAQSKSKTYVTSLDLRDFETLADELNDVASEVEDPTASAPGAPTITTITPGVRTLEVAFTAPASDGGSAISGYEYSLDGGTTWITPSTAITSSPFTITNLNGGRIYEVKIRAVNEVGSGEPSLTVEASPRSTTSVVSEPIPTPVVIPTVEPEPMPTPSQSPNPTITPPPGLEPGTSGDVKLMTKIEAIPGVVYSESNPIPDFIMDILSKPLAYILGVLSGDPELPELAPSESLAYENGAPVIIELVQTDSENGYVLRGDGWEVSLEATDSSGEPLLLDESGNIILNQDRYVQFSGTGFAPGSIVKVWLFSDPSELSDVVADAFGNFVGKAKIPEGIPTGEHTVQLNGLTEDGQLRSVSLGVLIQPDIVIAPAPPVGFDLTGLMSIIWILAAIVAFWFFILWRRRRKKEDEASPIPTGDSTDLIFASESFTPIQQFPNDSRRNIGPASPPNRKRFGFKPKDA